jgi:serine/threonine protein phosphatase PrpC
LFYDINAAIYNYGQKNGISVGTTYSLLWLADNRYLVIHAGDSRIYLKRGNSLYLLTKDQTWINEQLEHGFISAEQAKNHPKKNVLANCIGCFEIPSICTGEGEVMQNDKFLLCSDGLYNFLSIDEISAGMMNSDMNIGINMMLDLVKQRGAYDNITVSLVSVMGECGQESVTEGFV